MNVLMLGFRWFCAKQNPEMWNGLYNLMFRFTKPNGSFATFTTAVQLEKDLNPQALM